MVARFNNDSDSCNVGVTPRVLSLDIQLKHFND